MDKVKEFDLRITHLERWLLKIHSVEQRAHVLEEEMIQALRRMELGSVRVDETLSRRVEILEKQTTAFR